MNQHNGGPAFPIPGLQQNEDFNGMTLRDYFAAQALNGIEASQGNSGNFVSTVAKVAERAYQLADAMLAARSAA